MTPAMDFGFAFPGRGSLAVPDILVKLARKAEQVAQQMKATKNGRPLADARL